MTPKHIELYNLPKLNHINISFGIRIFTHCQAFTSLLTLSLVTLELLCSKYSTLKPQLSLHPFYITVLIPPSSPMCKFAISPSNFIHFPQDIKWDIITTPPIRERNGESRNKWKRKIA